jgi:hypothetical protein
LQRFSNGNGPNAATFQSNATHTGCNAAQKAAADKITWFQSNATRMGCNSKLAQMKQRVVMHFVQCLSVFFDYT